MTPATLTEPPRGFGAGPLGDRELAAGGAGVRLRARRSGGGRLTLEQLLDSVWEGLHADGAAECPVCAGLMSSTAAGAACTGCGSALS